MAQFFKPQKRNKPVNKTLKGQVSALDHQARAVVRSSVKDQPTRFITGALPGEVIQYKTIGRHSGRLERVLESVSDRRGAPCPHYERCGGCDFQHTHEAYQQAHKQQVVEELFQKFGVLQPSAGQSAETLPWQAPLMSEPIRYRRRIRLATRWLGKEQKLLIGFRKSQSHNIVAVDNCLVANDSLLQAVNALYPLLNTAAMATKLGHIEAINTNSPLILLRITDTLSADTMLALQEWQKQNATEIWLQTDATLRPLDDTEMPFDISIDGDKLYFQPGDFLQVNGDINQRMVQQAMDWLKPEQTERVYDFFAGIGNFSLPLARRAQSVLAVEGVYRMAEQTRINAEYNGLNNLTSLSADLNETAASPGTWGEPADLWCLDPARAGAGGVTKLLKKLKPEHRPKRILYVSCAPDTLARDIKAIKSSDYRISKLCTVDMFPQTHHIETMVCLERAL